MFCRLGILISYLEYWKFERVVIANHLKTFRLIATKLTFN